jgi:AAA15 family ATPase/GTPase
MLTKFKVQNFRGFKEEFTFNLNPVKSYTFNLDCIENGVVKKAIIQGKNGSGKSNLGLALIELTQHLSTKVSDVAQKQSYSIFSHASLRDEVTKFEHQFLFGSDTVRYQYQKLGPSDICSEFLWINDELVIKYEFGSDIWTNLSGTETLKKDIGETKLSALKYIHLNSVLTPDDSRANIFKKFYAFVEAMLLFKSVEGFGFIGGWPSDNLLVDIKKRNALPEFQQFLNAAGINLNLEFEEINGVDILMAVFESGKIGFWEIASSGTRSLVLFYHWLQRLRNNEVSFVFIDEFDAFYHFELAEEVFLMLKKANPQVVVTTHNSALMNNELSRPDCNFIIENKKIQPIYSLSSKELREAHNIEKIYRSGGFNGV